MANIREGDTNWENKQSSDRKSLKRRKEGRNKEGCFSERHLWKMSNNKASRGEQIANEDIVSSSIHFHWARTISPVLSSSLRQVKKTFRNWCLGGYWETYRAVLGMRGRVEEARRRERERERTIGECPWHVRVGSERIRQRDSRRAHIEFFPTGSPAAAITWRKEACRRACRPDWYPYVCFHVKVLPVYTLPMLT